MNQVIVGGVCLDRRLILRRLNVGTKHRILDHPAATIGGGAANHAICSVPLAPQTNFTLFAQVGHDGAGELIRSRLQRIGVVIPLVACDDLPTSESMIVAESEHGGRGTIFTISGARARELPLDRIEESLSAADGLSLCGPPINSQISSILRSAQHASVPVYFTLGSAQIDELSYDAMKAQLKAGVELVICNQIEAARLTGANEIESQLSALRFGGHVRHAIVTCGADGLWGFNDEGIVRQVAYGDRRPVVDDTGAGDATAAAIINAMQRGSSLKEAMRCGARNGFEACTGIGLENVCNRQQMDVYLGSLGHESVQSWPPQPHSIDC